MRGIAHYAWLIRWPVAVYLALYAAGAAIFLLTLRVKSEDGRLVINTRSFAYMLAHPMVWGGHRKSVATSGSICPFYARMFNMLLFVWPVLLVYFAIATIPFSLVGLLVGSTVAWPDLTEDAFIRLYFIKETKAGWPWPMFLVTGPAALTVLAVWRFAALLRFLSAFGWGLLCISPLLAVVAIAVGLIWKWRDRDSHTAIAIKEVIAGKKEKFCKLVEYR